MADLRFRAFRMKAYGALCPADASPAQRQELLEILDRQDEDDMQAFLGGFPLDANRTRALRLIGEARSLGERLAAMDRTLPGLPHAEITVVYTRLRAVGDELGDLQAQGLLG